jgi:hypothetical protein
MQQHKLTTACSVTPLLQAAQHCSHAVTAEASSVDTCQCLKACTKPNESSNEQCDFEAALHLCSSN